MFIFVIESKSKNKEGVCDEKTDIVHTDTNFCNVCSAQLLFCK